MARTRADRAQRVRIVGGIWRGRYLEVPAHRRVRPTPARVRETVFNWLAGHIDGARCLDLFAGSGALGFEAASRGAAQVTLVERERSVVQVLRRQAERLDAGQVEVVHARALAYLEYAPEPADLVFLDPPFTSGTAFLEKTCGLLARSRAVKDGGLVYVEAPASWQANIPATWRARKNRSAGQVGYHLFESGPDTGTAQDGLLVE